MAVVTTVRDFEPFTGSASLPAGVLGLGKMWAPGSGLQRGRGRKGLRRLGSGRCPCYRSFGGVVSSRSWGWAYFAVGVLGLGMKWDSGGVLD